MSEAETAAEGDDGEVVETEEAVLDVIVSVDTFQEFLSVLDVIVEEAVIRFREDEIYAEAVDARSVCGINQTMDSSAAEAYESSGVRVGVNLKRLLDYLDATDAELAHVTIDPETRMLSIEAGRVDISMGTIDTDSMRQTQTIEEIEIVEELDVSLTVDSGAFLHSVDLGDMVSDHVTFEFSPAGSFLATAEGDIDDVAISFDESVEGVDIGSEGEGMYSTDYLGRLAEVLPSGVDLDLRLDDEMPVLMDWSLADGQIDVLAMTAPRIGAR